MSHDDFFATPAFRPAEAVVGLKRQLRELGLVERGAGFELKGHEVVAMTLSETSIDMRLARRPEHSPDWNKHLLKNGADVRRFVDAVRNQLARWADDA